MLGGMSEPERTTSTTAEPPYGQGRWHRRGRPFRFAAVIVALAGIVFIIAVIFWSGFVLGACSGGHHGHHWGGHHWDGSRHTSMSSQYAPELASEGTFTA